MDIFYALEFWHIDALLDGAVCLKLACLHEANAECPRKEAGAGDPCKEAEVGDPPFLLYSREHLRLCEKVLVRGLKGVQQAHELEYAEEGMQEEVNGRNLMEGGGGGWIWPLQQYLFAHVPMGALLWVESA